jgi:opacity protein-like surface antigen
MRSFIFGCCIVALSLPAFAQPGPSVDFGLHANVTLLNLPGPDVMGSRPLKDVYGAGYGGGVHVDIAFLAFGVRLSGDYITFSPDNDKYRAALASLTGNAASDFSIDGGRVNIISVNANGKLKIVPLPIVSPYVTGGVGLARISTDAASVVFQGAPTGAYPSFASETQSAVDLGAGVDINLGLSLFVEAKYTWIFTEGQTSTYVPVTVGVTF